MRLQSLTAVCAASPPGDAARERSVEYHGALMALDTMIFAIDEAANE